MALKNLTIENFRGISRTYEFKMTNLIQGQNGARKSTIKEAICFLFCGTDSAGTKNPQHLISRGAKGLSVEGVTDRVTLSRTLTDKGNGTLKLVRDGIPSVLTQQQLEKFIGSTDYFLSVFCPGFFFSISAERQHKVLSEVLPAVDRHKLFEQMAGYPCTYDLSKRVDIVLDRIATDRRVVERLIDTKRGELKALQSVAPMPKPQEPAEIALQAKIEASDKAWNAYRMSRHGYMAAKQQYDWAMQNNQHREARRQELIKELETIQFVNVPELPDRSSEVAALRSQLKSPPPIPAMASVVDSDLCPSCGQTVGQKHRESVRLQNQKLYAVYEDQLKSVREHNLGIQARLDALFHETKQAQEQVAKLQAENRAIESRKVRIEAELTNSGMLPLPSVPPEPVAPEVSFTDQEKGRVLLVADEYRKAMAQYEYVQSKLSSAAPRIQALEQEITTLDQEVAKLQHMAGVVKVLPQEELKRQYESLAMTGLDLQVGDEIRIVTKEGMPYELLSTGQAMKANIELALKLNNLKQLGMMFIDNADLMDEVTVGGVQYFVAKVVQGQKEVTIT